MERIEFTEQEIKMRIEMAQLNLQTAGMVGMMLTAESNLNYYSDFRSHAPWTTFTRPSFLFVPVKGTPRLLVQTFLVPEAKAIAKGCLVQGFDSLMGPDIKDLVHLLEDCSMMRGDVGMELGHEQRLGCQVDTYEKLKASVQDVQFVDASGIIWKQRLIKSPKEIACHRKACEATSYAHDHIFDEVHVGMSEFEIATRVQQLMLEGGTEYPGFVIITSGTGHYGRISKTNSNRILEKGDLLWLDLGARYNGYWSDFCRAGEVGGLSKQRQDWQDSVHELTMAAAQSMKPGVPVSEVARACGYELEKRGHEATFDCGRMGHGMGLMSTEPPSVTLYDNTILQEGMIINLEPGIVNEVGVFTVEENFVITSNGFEVLSGGSRRLHEIR